MTESPQKRRKKAARAIRKAQFINTRPESQKKRLEREERERRIEKARAEERKRERHRRRNSDYYGWGSDEILRLMRNVEKRGEL